MKLFVPDIRLVPPVAGRHERCRSPHENRNPALARLQLLAIVDILESVPQEEA